MAGKSLLPCRYSLGAAIHEALAGVKKSWEASVDAKGEAWSGVTYMTAWRVRGHGWLYAYLRHPLFNRTKSSHRPLKR